MPISEYYKLCPECKENFDARRLNQKFCSAECKIHYNNRNIRATYHTRKQEDIISSDVNSVILKNRKLLKQFEGKTVKLEELQKLGFALRYVSQFEPKDGKKTLFYCYDMGYEFLDKFTLTIFKKA